MLKNLESFMSLFLIFQFPVYLEPGVEVDRYHRCLIYWQLGATASKYIIYLKNEGLSSLSVARDVVFPHYFGMRNSVASLRKLRSNGIKSEFGCPHFHVFLPEDLEPGTSFFLKISRSFQWLSTARPISPCCVGFCTPEN